MWYFIVYKFFWCEENPWFELFSVLSRYTNMECDVLAFTNCGGAGRISASHWMVCSVSSDLGCDVFLLANCVGAGTTPALNSFSWSVSSNSGCDILVFTKYGGAKRIPALPGLFYLRTCLLYRRYLISVPAPLWFFIVIVLVDDW